jgi:hypothetical protein
MTSWRVRWMGHLACVGQRRSVYTALMGKPEGEKPHGRPRHRWESNMKMDLKEVGCKTWTGLIWFRIGAGGWRL